MFLNIVRVTSRRTLHLRKFPFLMLASLCIFEFPCCVPGNITTLTLWTALSPLEWDRTDVSEDSQGRVTESKGFCTSDLSAVFLSCLAVIDLGALVYAVYEAYLARHLTTEFAESEHIAKALVLILSVCFLGIPVTIIAQDDPRANFFVLAGIIFAVAFSLLFFIFAPKEAYRRSNKSSPTCVSDKSIVQLNMPSSPCSSATLDGQMQGLRITDHVREAAEMKKELFALQKLVDKLRAQNEELGGTTQEQHPKTCSLGSSTADLQPIEEIAERSTPTSEVCRIQ